MNVNILKGVAMSKIESVQDFKDFLKENRDKLLEKAVSIENLPPDDEWINESEWDKVYAQGLVQNVKL